MNSWERLPIGELFSLEKGSLQSTKCTPGAYTFITASNDWKTHNEYSHDCEALIYAVAASGSLGRCHYFNGKFTASDLCFILKVKDEKKRPINYRFYQNIFKSLKEDIVAKTKAGTSKESISMKRLSNYKLPYINIKHQLYWDKKLSSFNEDVDFLYENLTTQTTLLSQLRQAILQEAIEGKLTAGWRKENPIRKGDPDFDAEALLKKIKIEKEKLIKEGKIKKQKPLAEIKAEEVPFGLPEGWVWTRLGEICSKIHYGLTASADFTKTEVRLLRITDIQNNEVNWHTVPGCDFQGTDLLKFKLKVNDILIARTGGTIGKTFLIEKMPVKSLFASYLIRIQPLLSTSPKFIKKFMETSEYWKQLYKAAWGAGQPNVNTVSLSNLKLPLPPLAEQQAIVERVEKLLSMVDELEKQVSERKEQAEQLMQAVLREAFEPAAAGR